MKTQRLKAPFPYFGGKSTVAPEIWKRFGKVNNYIEPFCGSLAVLLARPEHKGYETINDKSPWITNFWRAVKAVPEEVAEFCQHPVTELDLHSRHSWLQFEVEPRLKEMILADPEYYDSKAAGWWAWGQCLWIGAGWCGPHGLTKEGKTSKKRPDIKPKGVLTEQRRPDLSWRRGVFTQKPELKRQGLIKKQIPSPERKGVIKPGTVEFWIQQLCNRLQAVRVCCGDWKRVCNSPSVTTHLGPTAIFLDPPYGQEADRDMRLYAEESGTVAAEVREWCLERGPNSKVKIALCGYAGEHDELEEHGWSVLTWKANGGYANRAGSENCKKERIWFSPSCIQPCEVRHDERKLEHEKYINSPSGDLFQGGLGL